MLYKAIPESVAALLKNAHLFQLPDETYMAGGTAAAIYLGHRISIDIDLFTEKDFYCGPIISSIKKLYEIKVTTAAEKDTLIADINNVRFSLFRYPYPLLAPLVNDFDFNIKLASPVDIAAMKIVANRLSLPYLIAQVQKKYGVSEEYDYQIKKGLVYFDDAIKSLGDVTTVKDSGENRISKREWNEVEKFFKKLVLVR
ncbi:MAG: nucleotidyl transferase AbiEii/AbiGii toxin family protein [Nitrospinae bacterium]|nr:nucleotidyl transferase AbiEii/AbiGii toxin family protein [Nitrospinota bacterium]